MFSHSEQELSLRRQISTHQKSKVEFRASLSICVCLILCNEDSQVSTRNEHWSSVFRTFCQFRIRSVFFSLSALQHSFAFPTPQCCPEYLYTALSCPPYSPPSVVIPPTIVAIAGIVTLETMRIESDRHCGSFHAI